MSLSVVHKDLATGVIELSGTLAVAAVPDRSPKPCAGRPRRGQSTATAPGYEIIAELGAWASSTWPAIPNSSG